MSIVERIMQDALASANQYEADVREAQRLERLRRMQILVRDIWEWLEESDDAVDLAARGVRWQRGDGVLSFYQHGRTFEIIARDDMTFAVDGAIFHPNKDCPVLSRALHTAVMASVRHWARRIEV